MHREHVHLLHHLDDVEGEGVHSQDLEAHEEGLLVDRLGLVHPVEVRGSSLGLQKGVDEGHILPLVKDEGDAGVLVVQHDEGPVDA